MMNFKSTESKKRFLGIYEKAINQKFNWADKIDLAQQAGFDFMELSIDESEAKLARLTWSDQQISVLKQLLDQKKFGFNSMALSALRRFPLGSKDPQIRNRAGEIIHQAIVLAKKLGIRIIQLAAYDEYYNPSDLLTRKYFLTGLRRACALAERYSVTLALETMDTQFASTIPRCLNLLTAVASPALFIYPDLGNLSQFSLDLEGEISLGKPHIVAFHFKETAPGRFRQLNFGQGNVAFSSIFQTLTALQIYTPIVIEMWSANAPDESLASNLEILQQARVFYEQQWYHSEEANHG